MLNERHLDQYSGQLLPRVASSAAPRVPKTRKPLRRLGRYPRRRLNWLDIIPLQLIVFFSKNLLRHPLARSNLEEMTGESVFERYLPEPHPAELEAPENIRRHILCSGKSSHRLRYRPFDAIDS